VTKERFKFLSCSSLNAWQVPAANQNFFATGTNAHKESEVLRSCAIPLLLSRILQQEPRRCCAGFGIVEIGLLSFILEPRLKRQGTTQLILGTFRFESGPLKYPDKQELCRLRPHPSSANIWVNTTEYYYKAFLRAYRILSATSPIT
jgi:hypothetical protein